MEFIGEGVYEIVIVIVIFGNKVLVLKVGDVVFRIDLCYFRFVEVEMLLGDFVKVKEKLGWIFEIIV